MLTSILELGAWVGTLANGYLADSLGRRLTVLVAVVVFCVGVIVQACTQNKDYVFGGRFVTGLGVGSLSMIVPLYNAVRSLLAMKFREKELTEMHRSLHLRRSEDRLSLCSSWPLPLESWFPSG